MSLLSNKLCAMKNGVTYRFNLFSSKADNPDTPVHLGVTLPDGSKGYCPMTLVTLGSDVGIRIRRLLLEYRTYNSTKMKLIITTKDNRSEQGSYWTTQHTTINTISKTTSIDYDITVKFTNREGNILYSTIIESGTVSKTVDVQISSADGIYVTIIQNKVTRDGKIMFSQRDYKDVEFSALGDNNYRDCKTSGDVIMYGYWKDTLQAIPSKRIKIIQRYYHSDEVVSVGTTIPSINLRSTATNVFEKAILGTTGALHIRIYLDDVLQVEFECEAGTPNFITKFIVFKTTDVVGIEANPTTLIDNSPLTVAASGTTTTVFYIPFSYK